MKLIRFTKTDSKTDLVEFYAQGKLVRQLKNPKQRILPHDYIHALVESQLRLRGFIDLVFEGEDPEHLTKNNDETWLCEAMVESLQGMLWSGPVDEAQFNDWVVSICEQRKVASTITPHEAFLKLTAALNEAGKDWARLKVGQSVDFIWPH